VTIAARATRPNRQRPLRGRWEPGPCAGWRALCRSAALSRLALAYAPVSEALGDLCRGGDVATGQHQVRRGSARGMFRRLLAWADHLFAVALYKIVRSPGRFWACAEVYGAARAGRRHYGGSYMEEVGWAKSHKDVGRGHPHPRASEIGRGSVLMRAGATTASASGPSPCMHWGIYLPWPGQADRAGRDRGQSHQLDVQPGRSLPGTRGYSGIIGAAGLAVRRATDPELSLYTAR
jgi:hypothetical protein